MTLNQVKKLRVGDKFYRPEHDRIYTVAEVDGTIISARDQHGYWQHLSLQGDCWKHSNKQFFATASVI